MAGILNYRVPRCRTSPEICVSAHSFLHATSSNSRDLAKEPGAPRQIAWQLLDAGTSIGANTEEAKGAYSRRDFAAKNGIVLRECRETHFWLRLILATNLAPPERVQPLLQEADELVAIFTATVRRARLAKTIVTALIVLVVLLTSNF
jgi:four helix bundle protein